MTSPGGLSAVLIAGRRTRRKPADPVMTPPSRFVRLGVRAARQPAAGDGAHPVRFRRSERESDPLFSHPFHFLACPFSRANVPIDLGESMTEYLSAVQSDGPSDPTLAALRLAEEHACGGYLAARKSMVALAVQAVSLSQLADQQPTRLDYRRARDRALGQYRDAAARTRLAYTRWQRAQIHSDAWWTATEGRRAA